MKILKKDVQNQKLIARSKLREVSGQTSVFSYTVKKETTSIILSQAETGFSLSIIMEKLKNTLNITQFALKPCLQLPYLSPELSDAALLEIIVQALVTLFDYAQHVETQKMKFILSEDDAGYLTVFEGLFDESEPLPTQEMSFILYNTHENQDDLRKRAESIKRQLKQGLWQMQKGNSYIQNFLQNHQRGTLLPGIALQNEKGRGIVIQFPSRK